MSPVSPIFLLPICQTSWTKNVQDESAKNVRESRKDKAQHQTEDVQNVQNVLDVPSLSSTMMSKAATVEQKMDIKDLFFLTHLPSANRKILANQQKES